MSRVSKTLAVKVGNKIIGGGDDIIIQAMTNTPTEDILATTSQIKELVDAGAEIVRITVNHEAAAAAVEKIKENLLKSGCEVPLVGCFHYNGHSLLKKFDSCALNLDKYRINPGNVGFAAKRDKNFEDLINTALKYDKPVRIGVNWGSLDQDLLARLMDENSQKDEPKSSAEIIIDAMISSCLLSASLAEKFGLSKNKIILSAKTSRVKDLVTIYQRLAAQCNYPLHLGLTEAGMGNQAIVNISSALAILLAQGIGDTIRASITPKPGENRTSEVILCKNILQALGLKSFTPEISSCPGCGRTTSDHFQVLAAEINDFIARQMPIWQEKYPKAVNLKIAVMGCIVNGPGESKHADIGISLPGTGEAKIAPVFIDGEKKYTLRGDDIAQQFKDIIAEYLEEKNI